MYSLSEKHQQNVFFMKKAPTKCILYQKSTNKMYSLSKKHKQNVFVIKKAPTKCILYQISTHLMYTVSTNENHWGPSYLFKELLFLGVRFCHVISEFLYWHFHGFPLLLRSLIIILPLQGTLLGIWWHGNTSK